jgi:hypothetical protein
MILVSQVIFSIQNDENHDVKNDLTDQHHFQPCPTPLLLLYNLIEK